MLGAMIRHVCSPVFFRPGLDRTPPHAKLRRLFFYGNNGYGLSLEAI
jgi:hypothetical protein